MGRKKGSTDGREKQNDRQIDKWIERKTTTTNNHPGQRRRVGKTEKKGVGEKEEKEDQGAEKAVLW